MLTPSANIHHSKLPSLGSIVTMPGLGWVTRPKPRNGRYTFRRFIVESFPLCDSADSRYSRGIHTVNVRSLDDGRLFNVAGHWCEETI